MIAHPIMHHNQGLPWSPEPSTSHTGTSNNIQIGIPITAKSNEMGNSSFQPGWKLILLLCTPLLITTRGYMLWPVAVACPCRPSENRVPLLMHSTDPTSTNMLTTPIHTTPRVVPPSTIHPPTLALEEPLQTLPDRSHTTPIHTAD